MRPSSPPARRRSARALGSAVERRARWRYLLRGYRLLAANEWAGGYELDLVLRRGRRLVFCEVKGKSGTAFGDPLEMVDAEKQRRLRRAAETWLASRPELDDLEVRFDVAAARGRALAVVESAF